MSLVLAMAAARTWRGTILASDIDEVAVEVAEANLRANDMAGQVRCVEAAGFDHAALRDAAPFDLIFANILKGPLIALAPDLAAHLRNVVPDAHKQFLQSLHLRHQINDLFFAHAGIRPGVPLADQIENDLVWIRQEFLQDYTDHGALVVHGHTPVQYPELYNNRLAIDTGAGYGRALVPVVIDDEGVFALTAKGRQRLEETT